MLVSMATDRSCRVIMGKMVSPHCLFAVFDLILFILAGNNDIM